MQALILVLHVLVAVFLITLVLMQHGKGADAGASFGAGASSTVFGSQGSTPFLMKITALLAFVFFMTSLGLAYMAAHTKPVKSLVDTIVSKPAKKVAPAVAVPPVLTPKQIISPKEKQFKPSVKPKDKKA